MPLRVIDLQAQDHARWTEYVASHPLGTPFHELAWKECIEATYGYQPIYLVAESGGRIEGVLPLFLVKNLLMGRALLSTPFAVYGGALASSREALAALAREAAERARKLGVQYLELRNFHPDQVAGFEPVTRYVTFHQPIGATQDEILGQIPRKTRRMVRKSMDCPYEVRQTADFRPFFDLYSSNLRRLGTPCFPRRHFAELLRRFGDRVDVREYHLEGRLAAAVLTFYYRDQILPYYGASDPVCNPAAPNNYMYFDLMRWGAGHGYRLFDFGRSKKESGSYEFKAHWGMEEKELPYEILLVRRKEMPNFSPNNPRYQFAIRAWQRLPLPVTRVLGPWLVRLVP